MAMRPWPKQRIDECLRLYKQGTSISEIERLLKTSDHVIKKYLLLHGISIRDKSFYSKGSNNPSWKGGRRFDSYGYISVYSPGHPYRDKQNLVREHRLVMEKRLRRYLLPNEVVDHINGIKDDNRPTNLRVFPSNAEHLAQTLKGKVPKWTTDGLQKLGVHRKAA